MNASVKNNRTFFTKNTLLWVYTKTPTWELTGTVNTLMWELIGKDNGLTWVYTNTHTWELIGTVTWVYTNTLMWELIGKDNGLTWVYTNTHTWELIGKDDGLT